MNQEHGARSKGKLIELSCRECGKWKPIWEFDSSSVFGRPEGAADDEIAIEPDFRSPLCKKCSGDSNQEDQV